MRRSWLIWMLPGLLATGLKAQTPLFKWVSGDSLSGAASSISNTIPGPRQGSSSWMDAEGNFWLYGGRGYDLNEDIGFFNDLWKYSIPDKTWTWVQGTSTVNQQPSFEDNAISLDGADDLIEFDTLRNYRSDFTWEFWIKTEDTELKSIANFRGSDIDCCAPNTDGEFDLVLYFGGVFFFSRQTPNVFSSNTINDGNWHHIALVGEIDVEGTDDRFTIYVDGNKDTSTRGNISDLVDDTDTSKHVTRIGRGAFTTVDATIDEFKVWDRARSEQEIRDMATTRLNGDEANLVAYYDFNQGIADGDNTGLDSVIDRTANAFHGVLLNFDAGEPEEIKIYLDGEEISGNTQYDFDGLVDVSGGNGWVTKLGYTNTNFPEVFFPTPYSRESYFKGPLDEVRIWGRARTAAEIQAGLDQPLTGTEPDLLAYYDFNQGVPGGDNTAFTQLEDVTANAYDGNLLNFSLNGATSNFITGTPEYPAFEDALHFDAVDDHVEIDGPKPYNGDFTWEAWFKTDEDGSILSYTASGTSDGWPLGGLSLFLRNRSLNFDIGSVGCLCGLASVADDEWHHVAVTVSVNAFTRGLNQGEKSNWTTGIYPPSGRGRGMAAAFTDSQHDFWLFGGTGVDSTDTEGYFNDLRKYDPAQNEWVLISGADTLSTPGSYGTRGVGSPSNYPGSRINAQSWIDADDHIWVFGGFGHDKRDSVYYLNDLWNYDPGSGEWTWLDGADTTNAIGTYGTRGLPDVNNIPGARANGATWIDPDGNVWVFGGYGYTINSTEGWLNDLWKYDPVAGVWTWMGGTQDVDIPGVYGTVGVASEESLPGGRSEAITWVDEDGKLWLFGGRGYDQFGSFPTSMNDLWMYDPQSGLWTWMGGENYSGGTGVYEELRTPSTEYLPGSRYEAVSWTDQKGSFWLFGGFKPTQGKSGNYNDLWEYETTSGTWTWHDGLNSTAEISQSGVYGRIGDGSRQEPGARNGSLSWVDPEGNLWLLGGSRGSNGSSGLLNDLWNYDLTTSDWTYLGGSISDDLSQGSFGTKGIGSETNVPPSRWHAVGWTGPQGNLWFFGGIVTDGTGEPNGIAWRNDLWMYSPESNIYTWMGGSNQPGQSAVYGTRGVPGVNKIPGARSSSTAWVDHDGMMWLFGGYESFEFYNDLWRFNPFTREWTWVSGANSQDVPGTYGTKGVADPDNEPGARRYTNSWVDQEGNFWIFGGNGIDSRNVQSYLNDLWKYDPETDLWTWVHGSDTVNSEGYFGTRGVAAPENTPPARYGQVSWTDESGNLWLMGGISMDGWLNDLWVFDTKTGMWTWVAGSDQPDQDGTYGTLGVADADNVIGARERGMSFIGEDKKFWLFGGRRSGSIAYNDLWEITYIPGVPFVQGVTDIEQYAFQLAYDEPWATEFRIQVSLSSDFSSPVQDLTGVVGDTVDIASLQPGTNYYYRVRAANPFGESDYSDAGQVLTLPETPEFGIEVLTGLTQTSVTVNWEPTPEILNGYYLEVSTDSLFKNKKKFLPGYSEKAVDKQAVSDTIDNLAPGTRYYFRMRSYNDTGASAYSEVIEILTPPATPDFDGLEVVSGITQNTATVHWNAVPEILDGYLLDVSTDETFTDSTLFVPGCVCREIDKSATSDELLNLDPGTQYYFRLYAYNASGNSEPSQVMPFLTIPETPLFLGDTSITDITQTGATLNWSVVPEILDGYVLEISTDFNFSNNSFLLEGYGRDDSVKTISKALNTHSVEILEPGEQYFARARSFNSSGESPNSNVIIIQTVPASPEMDAAGNITQVSASLSWNTPEGAENYLLDVGTDSSFQETLIENFPVAVPFQLLNNLQSGTRYYTRVQSVNESGRSGSMDPPDYGSIDFITIPDAPFPGDPVEIGQTTSLLRWNGVRGADFYEIDVSGNGFQTLLTQFNALVVEDTSVLVSSLSPGVESQVRIRAVNESGASPNSVVLNVLTIPPTPIARDATSATIRSFRANWDPVEGAGFYVLEVSEDDFETFFFQGTFTSSNPVDITGLQENRVYGYRVRSGNASGESPNSNVISVSTVNNAQALAISSLNYSENFPEGTPQADIRCSVSGGQDVPTVLLRHRPVLGQVWSADQTLAADNNGEFVYTFTDAMLDEIGMVFDITVTDGFDTIRQRDQYIYRSFNNTQSDTIPILNFGGTRSSWQIISIPYELEDNLIETIFDEMGPFNYRTQWRLLHYRQTGDQGAYIDAGSGLNRIELGKGYWFNARSRVTIRVGQGRVNSAIPFGLSLVQGWNQVGNPYNIPLSWNEILSRNDAETLVDPLLGYDGETFIEEDVLAPFSGGFVWADEAVTLSVDPASDRSRNRSVTGTSLPRDIDGRSWGLPLHLDWDASRAPIGGIGMHEQAKSGKDDFDRLTVPRFLEYLEWYTVRDDYFYPWFSFDVVSTAYDHSWDFMLESNFVNGEVRLNWDQPSIADQYAQLWLEDREAGIMIDMKSASGYTFVMDGKHPFAIHYSADPTAEVAPSGLMMGDAFPNPVESNTMIPVTLPATREDYLMELAVYDLNGRKLHVLAEGVHAPGYYEFEWNGKDRAGNSLPTGVYLYRLSFDDPELGVHQKRLIIKP